MIACDRWDVVTALFPFTDAPVRKSRPMLVLSNAAFNRAHAHLIGCMITTAARSRWPSDYAIQDLLPTGLRHASLIRWKVFTLPEAFVGRRTGALSVADRSGMETAVAQILC